MPRPLRILYPNAWYHVMNRGAGRQMIFKSNYHRLIFLDLLAECHKMFNLKICAYCLMDNHYHLLVSTPDANLPRIMRHLNGVYTQKYNRSLKIDGPLFRGRYKAQLVEDDCYQLIVSRYIHLNPVEAGLVRKPSDYRWSSYSAYLEPAKAPMWLSTSDILKQITETKSLSHVKNYQDYVEVKNIKELNIFKSIKNTAPIIGSESFKEKILAGIDAETFEYCKPDINRTKTVPNLELIIDHVCIYYNIKHDILRHSKPGSLNWPKLAYIYICRKKFGYALQAISKSVGFLRRESVSTAIQECSARLLKFPTLANEIDTIVDHIKNTIQQHV